MINLDDQIQKIPKLKFFSCQDPLRIGKIMDHFLDEFSRKKDQEIVAYNREWSKEFYKVEMVED